jgi:oxygen-independent coproporphyrinogen-3 oxidase
LVSEKRFYHPANAQQYIQNMESGDFSWFQEEDTNMLLDTLLMGLRLRDGINIKDIEQTYGIELFAQFPELQTHLEQGLIEVVNHHLRLTRTGLLLGNVVFQTFVEGS